MSTRFAGAVLFDQIAAPASPASGRNLLYVKANGRVYTKDPGGTEREYVNLDEVQTLTNKSMAGTANTFTAIPASAVPNIRSVADSPTNAWDSLDRDYNTGPVNIGATGTMRLRFFTAMFAGTTISVSMAVGVAQSGFTFTVARHALYTIAANGDGTLVASTAHDGALFNTIGLVTKSWSVSYAMVAGQRYAVGTTVVYTGSGTAANMLGFVSDQVATALAPRLQGFQSGLSDIPSSFTGAAQGTTPTAYWYRLN